MSLSVPASRGGCPFSVLAARSDEESRSGSRYDTCPNGHDRSEKNTYVNPKTGRYACRVCSRESARARYSARLSAQRVDTE